MCGAWSSRQYRALKKTCPRSPPTPLHVFVLRKLEGGGALPEYMADDAAQEHEDLSRPRVSSLALGVLELEDDDENFEF